MLRALTSNSAERNPIHCGQLSPRATLFQVVSSLIFLSAAILSTTTSLAGDFTCPPQGTSSEESAQWRAMTDTSGNTRCALRDPVRPPNSCETWLSCPDDQLVQAQMLRDPRLEVHPSQSDQIKWNDPAFHLVTGSNQSATSCNGQLFIPVSSLADSRSVHAITQTSGRRPASVTSAESLSDADPSSTPKTRCFDQSDTRLIPQKFKRSGFSIYQGPDKSFYLMSNQVKPK